MSIKTKTCLIVEDQKASVEFIKSLVRATFPEAPIEVARSFKSAQKLLKKRGLQKGKGSLGLALVDIGLPDGSGIDVIQSISLSDPDAIPIVVTIYDDDSLLFRALSAGAKGYLLKESDPASLVEMVRRVEKNEPPLSPAIARKLIHYFQENKADNYSESRLSPREHETLMLVSRGLTVPEVSKQLGLSAQTVSGYVKIIYQKLHVSNRVELIREAIRRKLI